MTNRHIASIVLCFAICASCVSAQKGPATFDLVAGDGAKLRASYFSPGKPGPGLLLLHQCNMDRKSWDDLASTLVAKGIHVLTFDYRGYGDSASASGREKLESDIDLALTRLTEQPGVDTKRLAAGGASCGVNNAVGLARRSGKIKALMLLSGPTSKDGVEYLRTHPDIAIFGAASSEEDLPVKDLQALVRISTNPLSTMQVPQNAGHGMPMFTADPKLKIKVVDWLVEALK